MRKGDCLIFEYEGSKYGLILHHCIAEKGKTEYDFVIIGESFERTPSKSEIESCGILGYKYQNDTTDLLNSTMRNRQKYDDSTFYTGIRYDVVSIPKSFFDKRRLKIQHVANFNLNPEFYPIPNFHSRLDDYEKICNLIRNRIAKRDPETISWSTIYDAYPLTEVLIEQR